MAITIENLFVFIISFFDAFVIIQIFRLSLRKKVNRSLWLLMAYCFINSLVNYTGLYVSSKVGYYLYALYTIIEYCVFAYFILYNLQKKLPKKMIVYASVAFIAFNIYHTLYSKPRGLDSVPIAIETILIFLYCFYYLYVQMSEIEEIFIYNTYQFWIIIGIMVYLGGSFFIYISANVAPSKTLHQFWFLTYVFYIVKNIFFAIGIFYLGQKSKNLQHTKIYSYLN